MFNGKDYGLSWGIFHRNLRRICILLLLEKVFYKCQLDKVDCAAQIIHILIDFCLLDVSITDRGVLIFKYNIKLVSFFFPFYHILPHVLWHADVRCIHIWNRHAFLEKWTPYIMQCPSLSLIILLILKTVLFKN